MANYDRFIITRSRYIVPYTMTLGGLPRLGAGIDLTNPDDPNIKPHRPFPNATELPFVAPYSSDLGGESFAFITTQTVMEEAITISAYFRGAYPHVASLDAAYRFVQQQNHTSMSVYTKAARVDAPQEVDGATLDWDGMNLLSEAEPDDTRALDDFVQAFGTHFVSVSYWGTSIIVRATINERNETLKEELSSHLKGFGKVEAGIDKTTMNFFSQHNVDITAVVIGSSNAPGFVSIVRDAQELDDLLTDLKNGTIVLRPSVTTIECESFFPTLGAYPRTRELFRPFDGFEALSPYGVPAGTIVPWCPQPIHYVNMGGTVRLLRVPAGWALCDGKTNNTPDLRRRFIRGFSEGGDGYQFGHMGGASEHTHAAAVNLIGPVAELPGVDALTGLAVLKPTVQIEPEEHIPPYYSVMFIMKL